MSDEDIRDPRLVPRWLPVGIHGIPRSREWDAVVLVIVPELAGSPISEFAIRRLADGTLVVDPAVGVPDAALERIGAELADALPGPCEAVAVRRGVEDWSLAAREARLDAVELPALPGVEELSVALAPDGERIVVVDGEEVDPEGLLAEAVDILEGLGLDRYRAFAVRATSVDGSWAVAVDPL